MIEPQRLPDPFLYWQIGRVSGREQKILDIVRRDRIACIIQYGPWNS